MRESNKTGIKRGSLNFSDLDLNFLLYVVDFIDFLVAGVGFEPTAFGL